jgi:hypothetical protein
MKKTERLVFYYDLSIAATSRTFDAPKTISVRDAFSLMQLVPKEQRLKEHSKGKELLYVADWDWPDGGNVISILVNKSDKSISDPVFTVPRELKRRTAEKVEEEGQDFSIHMVVCLPENELDCALVILEHCSGLGAFFVEKLFNEILKDARKISPEKFEQNHPDGALDEKGNPKKYNVTFKCALDGHVSDELKNDLDQGKLHSIELITDREQHTPFDEDGFVLEKCKTVVLVPKDDTGIVNKFARLGKVFNAQKDNYSKAKIKFRSPSGLERTIEMATADGLASAYVKKGKLEGFGVDLQSSYDSFHPPMLEKIKALLTD